MRWAARAVVCAMIGVVVAAPTTAAHASAIPVPLTSVEGWPHGRTSNDPPPNAVDGSTDTFTWTTEAFNFDVPSYLGVGFSRTNVNRLRLWKSPNGGGGENVKNLVIQYTNDDPVLALDARTWRNTSGLSSGAGGGVELFHAAAVNPDGTVVGDVHNSPGGDGWGSLTFATVTATGIRIAFNNPSLAGAEHYRVGEIQVIQANPPRIYFTEQSGERIRRIDVDGTNATTLVTGSAGCCFRGLAVDLVRGKMYWPVDESPGAGKIRRSNLDGSNIEDIVSGLNGPVGVAVDPIAGKLYWTETGFGFSPDGAERIRRANLDGTGAENLVTTGLAFPTGLALDTIHGRLYWADEGTGKIQGANLDGTGLTTLATASAPIGVAVDPIAGKLYWSEIGTNQIRRANLDGTGATTLFTSQRAINIALDTANAKIYWTDNNTAEVHRGNLDGTGATSLFVGNPGTTNPWGIAIDNGAPIPLLDQTITFNPLPDQTFGNPPFTVTATASSGLPVSFGSAGGCTVSAANVVTLISAGTCTIVASQGGNATYNAAPNVSRSFAVAKVTPTITWAAPADITYGTPLTTTQLNATANVPGSFVYNPASGVVLPAGNGQSLSATFTPTDTANYNVASKAVQINVLKGSQTLTVAQAAPSTAIFGTAFSVSATGGGSGNPVVIGASPVAVCSASGNTITMNSGTGTCTVTFDQAGNDNYDAAPQVVQTTNAQKASQTLSFGTLVGKTYGDADFTVSATASSGLTVALVAGGHCTMAAAATIHLTGAGTCTVTVQQAGDANYHPAPDLPQSFPIAKASATLTLGATIFVYDGTPKPVAVTTNPNGLSGVSVTYAGSPAAPTNGGSYAVVASLSHDNFQASNAIGTLAVVRADAGADQIVNEGDAVTLNGSASYGIDYQWTQIAGVPAVTLSGDGTPSASFTAPQLTGGFGSTVLTFQLRSSDGVVETSDTVNVTVTNVNHGPIAEPGRAQTVSEGSVVTLNGSLSYDPDDDPIVSHQWTQTYGPPVVLTGGNTATAAFTAPFLTGGISGTLTLKFTLMVSDGALSNTSQELVVMVTQLNNAPTANAGTNQTINVNGLVTLSGSGQDPDGDPISYVWTQTAGTPVTLSNISATNPTFTAPGAPGPLTFGLVTSDGALSSPPSSVMVTVVAGPPVCTAAQSNPSILWPPNHKMVPVNITGVTDPNNYAVTITITSVTQDEPTRGLGDGDTPVDAMISGGQLLLRAERSGTGNGRVYTVNFRANDDQGGSCTGSVKIGVPHDQGNGRTPIDSGQNFNSMQ